MCSLDVLFSTSNFNVTPFHYFVEAKQVNKFEDFKDQDDEHLHIAESCRDKCIRLECSSSKVQYFGVKNLKQSKEDACFIIYNSGFEISSKTKLKLNPIDLFDFIAGIVGIWVGLFFMDFARLLKSI